MIKVLFLIHDLSYGGAEKVLVNLVNNIDKSKFDVTLISLFDGGVNKQFLRKEVKYKYCFKRSIRGNSQFMKIFTPDFLFKKFIHDEYDVLVSYLEGVSARIIWGSQSRAKKICWIHCTMNNKKQLAKAFRNYQEAVSCYSSMDQMVFVSKGVQLAFERYVPNLKNKKIIYNTNETNDIMKLADKPLQKDDLRLFQNSNFKICYVGKLTKNKGIERMARIHVKLRKYGYKVNTYVLGTGEEEENIRNYVESNNCSDSFFLLGFQVNPYQFMKKCDWYVCSSYTEGFSTAATEALILGLPVITTKVSGMSEMLGDNNEYGIIVKNDENALYEGLIQIIKDHKLTTLYKKRAQERGKYFSKEQTVKAVEKFLKDQV